MTNQTLAMQLHQGIPTRIDSTHFTDDLYMFVAIDMDSNHSRDLNHA